MSDFRKEPVVSDLLYSCKINLSLHFPQTPKQDESLHPFMLSPQNCQLLICNSKAATLYNSKLLHNVHVVYVCSPVRPRERNHSCGRHEPRGQKAEVTHPLLFIQDLILNIFDTPWVLSNKWNMFEVDHINGSGDMQITERQTITDRFLALLMLILVERIVERKKMFY